MIFRKNALFLCFSVIAIEMKDFHCYDEQKEVTHMTLKKTMLAKLARLSAETALRRDANRTTCLTFFQPKAPIGLDRFKKGKL